MLKLYINWSWEVIGIKSNVLYSNICGAGVFPSYKLDRIIRYLGTPSVHHERIRSATSNIIYPVHVNRIE